MRPADTTGAAGAGPPGAERFKEVKEMKKRIVGTLMALLLAATVLPPGAISVTSADVTTGLVTTAYAEGEHKHCVCNKSATDSKHTHNKEKTWDAWYDVSSLPESGTYYLTGNVTMAKAWEPTGDVELCLNGNTIEFTEAPENINADTNYAAIILKGAKDNQVLTITSCMSGGIIRAANRNLNHGVYMDMPKEKKDCAATVNYYGNSVTSIYGFRDDGIYVGTGSNLVANIWGGRIAGNSRGVSVRNGVCNMYGGTISSNTVISTIYSSSNGGGVYIDRGATFNMYGGTIEKNSAVCKDTSYGLGGGVAIEGNSVSRSDATTHGTFNMYGGTISGNTAGKNGGGVYVGEGTTFNMYGGTISGNKVEATGGFDGNGGGVYVQDGTFNMDGGLISGNAASESNYADGGGVFVIGNFTMSDGTISGNKAYRGAGVQVGDYYPNGSLGSGTFTMTGGIIGGTTADAANIATYGGGVNVWSTGTFDLRSGSIIGNEANGTVDENGGGVHSNGTFNVSGDPIVKSNTREIQGSTYADNVDSSDKAINVVGALRGAVEIVVNRTSKTKITGVATYYSAIPNDDESVTLRAPTGSSGGETDVAVESVSLNKTSLTLVEGNSESLTATVTPDNATNKTVTWSSSNTAVATVENGVVKAVGAGTATITATAGEKSATCAVTVSAAYVPATAVQLSQETAEIRVGETLQLTATVKPDNATDKTVRWSSSNAEIATVDANGLVKGLKTGEVSISAITADNRGATCGVTVTAAQTGETKYALTVNNGTGSGEYAEGEVVTITADPAAQGKMFYRWEGADGLEFVGGTAANEATAKFKMPSHTVTLTAAYIPQGVIDIVITPNGGEFTDSVEVTLASTRQLVLSDLKLYYTTDGTGAHDSATRKVYTGPFTLTETCTVNVALYTVSKEDGSERIYTTKSATFTKTGGDTPTPTPTPEAPRYYYSSGSGSTGAGGLSAVQNDPNGKSATDYSGGIYGLLFRTNAALSAFRGVQVDGVTIGAANYSVEGNEVYLKAVYLQTLANGKHTLTVLSGEGNATAEFTVGGVVSAPKTADAGALAYLGLALSSYVGTALVTRRKKEF